MNVQSSNLRDLVAQNVTSFFIPPYQRAYAWRSAEIARFFGDLCRIIESELDEECRDKLEHFFGTLVIKNEPVGIAGTRTIIIDGQQRVTTALVLLMAVRDLLSDQTSREQITGTYLVSPSSTFEDKIKLKQVTRDWDAYRALVLGHPMIPGAVTEAYKTFRRLLTDYCAGDERVTPKHFVMALGRVNVAVIILDERPHKGEDPQIIFETLNSLGRPLTFSDLIRNFILLNMDSQRQTEAYEKIWYPRIEEPLGVRTSAFLRDYLQLKLATSLKSISDSNTKELYQQFKDYVAESESSRDELIADLVDYIDCYRFIIDPDFTRSVSTDPRVKELTRNIFQDIGTEAFKPLVLGLLHHHCHSKKRSDARLLSLLTDIRTYLIRRRVCKLSQGENKALPRLCDRIEEIYSGETDLLELLSSQFYRLRIPNDIEVRSTLETISFYKELASYTKLILGKIEEHRTKVSVDFRDPKITIEHIMPQTITDSWREELGEEADEIHARYLHNIGNLILTEFNVEMSNTSFENKKKRLVSSSLAYRLDIMDKERWTLESILSHQKVMIDAFIDTFPLPEQYQKTENWKRISQVITDFSPLESGINRLLAGEKPVSIRLDDVTAPVHSWQEVFLQFIKLVIQKRTTLQYLKDNQQRLFNRTDALLTWQELRQDPSLVQKGYHKNFAGEYAFQATEPRDDDELVHINISSNTCILRIAKTMTDLGMNKDSVSITIQKKQSGESDTPITSLPLIPNS